MEGSSASVAYADKGLLESILIQIYLFQFINIIFTGNAGFWHFVRRRLDPGGCTH